MKSTSTVIADMADAAAVIANIQTELIAKYYGRKTEDITSSFIDQALERDIYPKTRFGIGSQYGGYHCEHLQVLSGEEVSHLLHG